MQPRFSSSWLIRQLFCKTLPVSGNPRLLLFNILITSPSKQFKTTENSLLILSCKLDHMDTNWVVNLRFWMLMKGVNFGFWGFVYLRGAILCVALVPPDSAWEVNMSLLHLAYRAMALARREQFWQSSKQSQNTWEKNLPLFEFTLKFVCIEDWNIYHFINPFGREGRYRNSGSCLVTVLIKTSWKVSCWVKWLRKKETDRMIALIRGI